MAKSAETTRVQIRRRMPAPRDVVYAAWTQLDGIRTWMCPGDVTSAEGAMDVRVGGSFRLVMKSPSQDHVHTGIYKVVEPNAKLVFTWTAGNQPETLVTVEFLDRGPESELLVTHERFTDPAVAQRYEGGWGTIAQKFAAYLAGNKR